MRILYIGDNTTSSTSFHRASALQRLGHEVEFFVPQLYFKSIGFWSKISYRTGYQFIQKKILIGLKNKISFDNNYDIVWINSGEWIGTKCLKYLKNLDCRVVLYINDDPTGKRDGNRFVSLLKALPLYDLCVVVRKENFDEFKRLGCENILRVYMSYDEVAHKAYDNAYNISTELKSEVCFIGTWMRNEKRDVFLLDLINAGIPLSIWGARWEKSPYWNLIKPYYRDKNLFGEQYISAIQGAKVCLGLLSKGNRDLHTTRSMEIPYAGGLLCAERTSEHLELYKENEEAVFWSDAIECIEKCKWLLNNDIIREQIKINGMKRVRENLVGNENIVQQILDQLNLDQLKKTNLLK